jgi:hypothetical protein
MVGGSLANSVSFRHGTNVEFEGPSFVGGIPPTAPAKVSPGPLIYDSSLCKTSYLHCSENTINLFHFWELRDLSPNFHIFFCERFIYSQYRSTCFPAAGKADRLWEYINCSQTHECGNRDCVRAIPFLGIFVSNFGYWFFAVYGS